MNKQSQIKSGVSLRNQDYKVVVDGLPLHPTLNLSDAIYWGNRIQELGGTAVYVMLAALLDKNE